MFGEVRLRLAGVGATVDRVIKDNTMRSRQTDHRPPILVRTITLGRWSSPNLAEVIVVAVMATLVIMVWSYVV